MVLISIDPGTSTCGVAIWELDNKFKIISLNSFTIIIDVKIRVEERINILYKQMFNIVHLNKPYQLIHESGFIDRFRPQAYGPIYAAIFMIRQSFKDVNGSKTDKGLFNYSPKYIKASISTGDAGKDDMAIGVKKIKELKKYILGNESEHAIDAIAIGYTHIKHIRDMPEILLL